MDFSPEQLKMVRELTAHELVKSFEQAAMRYGQSDPALVFDVDRQSYGERCVLFRQELLRRLESNAK